LPPRPADRAGGDAWIAYLGITHSHPEWLVRRWLTRFGFDATEQWVRFNNTTPHLTLRANTLRTDRLGLAAVLASDGIETTPTPFAPDGLLVTSGNPLRHGSDGSFFVQDEASQLVALTLDSRPGHVVLDLCASPGGKTTALAGLMADAGHIIATDVRARRLALLRKTVALSGARSIRIVQVPGRGTLPLQTVFDRILVDAPCSGLGTIRRDPDIRWRRTEDELRSLAVNQLDLIRRASELLKPGGRLVYATCSSEPEENEQVVDEFLASNPAFALLDLRPASGTLAPPHLRTLAPLLDDRGMLRTFPHAHGLEAFFAAAIVRGTISAG
jgi:16S rRNA (cytosine967-C5)-methyltransferase